MPGRAKLSDVLRALMVQNRGVLLPRAGMPPQGKCIDCKRDVLAMEMYARCPNCEQSMICVNCVDAHDHLHSLITRPDQKFDLDSLLSLAERRN